MRRRRRPAPSSISGWTIGRCHTAPPIERSPAGGRRALRRTPRRRPRLSGRGRRFRYAAGARQPLDASHQRHGWCLDGRALVAGDVLPVGMSAPTPSGRPRPRAPLPLGCRAGAGPAPSAARPAGRVVHERGPRGLARRAVFGLAAVRPHGLPARRAGACDEASRASCSPNRWHSARSRCRPAAPRILLMADRQTAGGYPKIATVITADLPLAGQLAPGERCGFPRCSARRGQ